MTWVALKSLIGAAHARRPHRAGHRAGRGDDRRQPHPHRHHRSCLHQHLQQLLHQDRPRRARHPGGRRLVRRRPHGARRRCCRRSGPSPASPGGGGNLVDLSGLGQHRQDRRPDGKVISGNMPTFGFGVDPAQPRFNPLTLAAGHWATGPDQVVIDVGTAAGHGFAVGDRVGVAAEGPVRDVHGHRPRPLRRRRLPGRRDHRRLRHPDRPRRCSARPASTPSRSPPRPGVSRGRAGPRASRPCCPRASSVSTGDEQAARDKEVDLRGDHLHPRLPAVLRRHRPVRRRVRHLQHPVDHGRPALARAGDAAHPRRLAPAGAALGDRRGRPSSASRPRSSAWRSASASPRA